VARIEIRPRKAPRQKRSSATVETLLDAAARVLDRESLAGFNTNRIAEVAGVSVGSLYQYFPNKAALVAALIDRHQQALADEVERCVREAAGRPLVEALAKLTSVAIAQQYRKPVLAAALDHEERRLPVGARLRAAERRIALALQELLGRHRAQLPTAPSAGTIQDLLVITKALVEADAEAGKVPAADLQARVVKAQWGYLFAEIPTD
jgi:AcrR family transcriptional regulator